jgi:hypothetical protein
LICSLIELLTYVPIDTILEELAEQNLYNINDIQRFNEIDAYARMFIEHAQNGKTFDENKACRLFHDTMLWRQTNNVYGR